MRLDDKFILRAISIISSLIVIGLAVGILLGYVEFADRFGFMLVQTAFAVGAELLRRKVGNKDV